MLSASADPYGSRIAMLSWEGQNVEVVRDSWLVRMPQNNATTARNLVDYRSAVPSVPSGWIARSIGLGMYGITAPGESLTTVSQWARTQGTLWMHPNFFYRKQAVVPNEGLVNPPTNPGFGSLWGHNNTGQFGDLDNEPTRTAQGPGITDADIDAPEAWDINTGSNQIIIAVLDDGIDYTHPDLRDNMWQRPENVPASQYGLHGWDSADNDGDVRSALTTDSHGTHVAGTIGASGNNGTGVTGVAWDVQLYGAKVFRDGASGSTIADQVDAISKVIALRELYGQNVVAINASLGGYNFNQAREDVLRIADAAGILFVAAAGNDSNNNDRFPVYPAGHNVPNVISVAASNRQDQLAVFSNFGLSSVDIAAPGSAVWSSIPGSGYDEYGGTSMAAPHVAGVAALVASAYFDEYGRLPTVAEMKSAILDGADRIPGLTNPSTGGRIADNRRLNAHKAIQLAIFPRVTIPRVTVVEGHDGSSFAEVIVTLSAPSQSFVVTMDYATADGSARDAENDYVAASGTLTFAPGETTKSIRIEIVGDRKIEFDETFLVRLTNLVNTVGSNLIAEVTIQNDDFPPSLSVDDIEVVEGASGVIIATFTVSLTTPLPYGISVRYVTLDRTARTRDADYRPMTGTIMMPAGETAASVTITVMGDTRYERDETFVLQLRSSRGVPVSRSTAFCTIVNDDPAPVPAISVADVRLLEGSFRQKMVSFTVTLSMSSPDVVTISYRTIDGSAVAGEDYIGTVGKVSFSPGTTRRSIAVWVLGDMVAEPTEQFALELLEPSGISLGRALASGTIIDDDSRALAIRRSNAAMFAAAAADDVRGRNPLRRR
jgi:subtilisin family serine protease